MRLPPALGGGVRCDNCGSLLDPTASTAFGMLLGEDPDALDLDLCDRCGTSIWAALLDRA